MYTGSVFRPRSFARLTLVSSHFIDPSHFFVAIFHSMSPR